MMLSLPENAREECQTYRALSSSSKQHVLQLLAEGRGGKFDLDKGSPQSEDGPARDVFATVRHGEHGQRKHTRSAVPYSLPLSRPGEGSNTKITTGAMEKK